MNAGLRAAFAASAVLAGCGPARGAPGVALPAGTLGGQVAELARSMGASVVVPDAALWARRVPGLRGRFPASEALRRLARAVDARVEVLGFRTYRLVGRSPAAAREHHAPRMGSPPADAGTPSDVVVTASKRGMPRGSFAGQVTSVYGVDLGRGGAGGTERLVERSAAIASTYLGAGRNKLFIRGIADSSFTGPTQATVGQYYGDLRLSYNAPDPDLRLADLAAVEILEGPQGTLYGAGSLGGLIRLVPNPVDLTRTTGAVGVGGSATAHGAPGGDALAVLNLPLLERRLAVRLVGGVEQAGGYIDKPVLGRRHANRTRIVGGRATVHLALGGDWSVEAVGIGQLIAGADGQYADRDGRPLTRLAPVREPYDARFGQLQMVIDGLVGAVHVRSSTGVTGQMLSERYDATFASYAPQIFAQASRTRMHANETRVWRTSPEGAGWLAGLSYIDNRSLLIRSDGTPEDLVPTVEVLNRAREVTAYGEASVPVLRHLLVTGGVRLTRTALSGSIGSVPSTGAPPDFPASDRRVETRALPAASAVLALGPGSAFVRYQQGFRPGGLAVEGRDGRPFRGDRVATLETGYRRGRRGTDRFDFSACVAHTAWRDIQADFIDEFGFPSTANVGDGELWTLEGSAGLRVGRGLRLEGDIVFNRSRIREGGAYIDGLASDAPAGLSSDAFLFARLRQVPNIARITLRASASYDATLVGGIRLGLDVWARYVGPSRLGVGPVLGQVQGRYVEDGARIRLGRGASGLTIGLTNILGGRGNRFALGTPIVTGRDQVTPLRPRTVRLGLDFAF